MENLIFWSRHLEEEKLFLIDPLLLVEMELLVVRIVKILRKQGWNAFLCEEEHHVVKKAYQNVHNQMKKQRKCQSMIQHQFHFTKREATYSTKCYMFFTSITSQSLSLTSKIHEQSKTEASFTHQSNTVDIMGEKRTILQIKRHPQKQLEMENDSMRTNINNNYNPTALISQGTSSFKRITPGSLLQQQQQTNDTLSQQHNLLNEITKQSYQQKQRITKKKIQKRKKQTRKLLLSEDSDDSVENDKEKEEEGGQRRERSYSRSVHQFRVNNGYYIEINDNNNTTTLSNPITSNNPQLIPFNSNNDQPLSTSPAQCPLIQQQPRNVRLLSNNNLEMLIKKYNNEEGDKNISNNINGNISNHTNGNTGNNNAHSDEKENSQNSNNYDGQPETTVVNGDLLAKHDANLLIGDAYSYVYNNQQNKLQQLNTAFNHHNFSSNYISHYGYTGDDYHKGGINNDWLSEMNKLSQQQLLLIDLLYNKSHPIITTRNQPLNNHHQLPSNNNNINYLPIRIDNQLSSHHQHQQQHQSQKLFNIEKRQQPINGQICINNNQSSLLFQQQFNDANTTLGMFVQAMQQEHNQIIQSLINESQKFIISSPLIQNEQSLSLNEQIQHISSNHDYVQSLFDKVMDNVVQEWNRVSNAVVWNRERRIQSVGEVNVNQLKGNQLKLYELIKEYAVNQRNTQKENFFLHRQYQNTFQSLLTQYLSILQIDFSHHHTQFSINNNSNTKPPPQNSNQQQPTTASQSLLQFMTQAELKTRQLQQTVNMIYYNLQGVEDQGQKMYDWQNGQVIVEHSNHYHIPSTQFSQSSLPIDLNSYKQLIHTIQKFLQQKENLHSHYNQMLSSVNKSFIQDKQEKAIHSNLNSNLTKQHITLFQQSIQSIIDCLNRILKDIEIMNYQIDTNYKNKMDQQ